LLVPNRDILFLSSGPVLTPVSLVSLYWHKFVSVQSWEDGTELERQMKHTTHIKFFSYVA
jgi:hypothetical protein